MTALRNRGLGLADFEVLSDRCDDPELLETLGQLLRAHDRAHAECDLLASLLRLERTALAGGLRYLLQGCLSELASTIDHHGPGLAADFRALFGLITEAETNLAFTATRREELLQERARLLHRIEAALGETIAAGEAAVVLTTSLAELTRAAMTRIESVSLEEVFRHCLLAAYRERGLELEGKFPHGEHRLVLDSTTLHLAMLALARYLASLPCSGATPAWHWKEIRRISGSTILTVETHGQVLPRQTVLPRTLDFYLSYLDRSPAQPELHLAYCRKAIEKLDGSLDLVVGTEGRGKLSLRLPGREAG